MGAVDTTYTFTATDTITSTKMNDIIDQTTITGDAIFGTTLEVVSGKLKIRAQGITSNEMGVGCVTSTAILNGTIIDADINDSANISGSKLADLSITSSKLGGSGIPLQMSQIVKRDNQTVTAGSWVDIGSFTITTTRLRLTSKHRIQAVISCTGAAGAAGVGGVGFRIIRRIGGVDTTVGVGISTAGANAQLVTSYGAYLNDRSVFPVSIDFIDDTSANTAASISYVIQVISQSAAYINRSIANDNLAYTHAPISTLTVTELS